ncbi:MAG: DUF1566 domain-containing protein [Paludibacteraceae bacterium]|nr:DUF1566 domain-containing protein [Paludibacteraceae bacterium]
MKKFIVSCIMSLITILSFGQDNMMLHVYRNDGVFNAFYTFEIDSMFCSVIDTMENAHDGYVVQEFYTRDSLYRIPLSAIDSIVFVTPKIEYNSDVRTIDTTWIDYVDSVDGLTIILNQDIPSNIIPNVGEVLLSETNEAPFIDGFVGRVFNVESQDVGIVISCDSVTLSDIYKTLIYKGKSVSTTEVSQVNGQRILDINKNDKIYFDIPRNLSMNLGPMTLSVSPVIELDYNICVNDNQTYIDCRLKHYYDCSAQLDCDLKQEYKPDPKYVLQSKIPTGIPGFYVDVDLGSFLEASGDVAISMVQPFAIIGTTGFVYSNDSVTDIDSWDLEKKDVEFSANLNGDIWCGLLARVKMSLIADWFASIDVTGYLGPELSANFSLSSEGSLDGSLYTTLKGSAITLYAYGKVEPSWSFYGCEHKMFNENPSFRLELKRWYFLPEFNNLLWTSNEGTNGGDLSGDIQRDLFWPGVELGWALCTENGQIHSSQYYPKTYRLMSEWAYDGLAMNLKELPYGCKYKAYPMIKILGHEMRALPSVDVSIDPLVETGKAFNIGETSATVSGRVEGMDYSIVADAGICYSIGDAVSGKYISSNSKNDGSFDISISGLERNTTYFYCTYLNCDGEYYYGEVQSFKTLEKFEPKAVDLGLSVKWATCNVGANSPEEYGDYFAWGEVEPKTTYDWITYKYGDSDQLTKYCHNSSYGNGGFTDNKTVLDPEDDAATVNWGGAWRMPTRAEQDELRKKCTWTWTTQNGVSGYKVTGPNGNSIFLPAAGYMYEGTLKYAGGSGHYWSSSLAACGPSYAYLVCFDVGNVDWYNGHYRYYGLSVRPVCQ